MSQVYSERNNIMGAEENEKSTPENKLTIEDMQAVFHILLKYAGGSISIPVEVLENYPKGLKFVVNYDEVNKVWHFFVPRKRARKTIAVLRKDLIVPGQF